MARFPAVRALGVEGLAVVQSVGLTSWVYSALDGPAKYVFAFLLLGWAAADEGAVASSARGPGASSTPADD